MLANVKYIDPVHMSLHFNPNLHSLHDRSVPPMIICTLSVVLGCHGVTWLIVTALFHFLHNLHKIFFFYITHRTHIISSYSSSCCCKSPGHIENMKAYPDTNRSQIDVQMQIMTFGPDFCFGHAGHHCSRHVGEISVLHPFEQEGGSQPGQRCFSNSQLRSPDHLLCLPRVSSQTQSPTAQSVLQLPLDYARLLHLDDLDMHIAQWYTRGYKLPSLNYGSLVAPAQNYRTSFGKEHTVLFNQWGLLSVDVHLVVFTGVCFFTNRWKKASRDGLRAETSYCRKHFLNRTALITIEVKSKNKNKTKQKNKPTLHQMCSHFTRHTSGSWTFLPP